MTGSDGSTDWAAFVLELAAAPALVQRLRDLHVPDRRGRCRTCTTPGYGTPHAPWPCTIRGLADQAASVIVRRPGPLKSVDDTVIVEAA